ncbi:T9SS type A sorting domain-containing protein [Aequorivita ciconiae]|uniref:T9SS type A sorting domain-containing protein n=1 Tax=Aequorivita ciconiae TaxID=2494375 RepID=UPI001F0B7F08|nr:T9SS type A sorting domain-containing protein [Aequorivita sp. H23M31]
MNREVVAISVHDILGRKILTTEKTFSENTIQFNLPEVLNIGIYMVTISYNGESKNLRIIKK